MKLVPCDRKEVGNIYKPTKNFDLLQEFASSDLDCVRVIYDCKNAEYAVNSIRESIKRFRMDGIRAIKRKDKVYLIKDI